MTRREIFAALAGARLPLSSEQRLQDAIEKRFADAGLAFEREKRLSAHDVVDFMVGTIAVEVKIKGGKRDIYRQCSRYCEHESVAEIVLVTNLAMGLPEEICGKPASIFNLAMAWL
jgi:hypothetical protein